jgi:hypothetical protein
MRPRSWVVGALLLAVAVFATETSTGPGETTTTSALLCSDAGATPVGFTETTGGTMTTGAATDPGNSRAGGASIGSTRGGSGAGPGGTAGMRSPMMSRPGEPPMSSDWSSPNGTTRTSEHLRTTIDTH